MLSDNTIQREKAILVGVSLRGNRWQTEDHLRELALLADTAGALVVDTVVQEKDRIDAAYFVGRGKAEMLSELVQEKDASMLVFDDDLSPAQARNLEKLTGKKVLDRSGIILDIFAKRAQTKEAKTQVELAQLNYLLPRLTRQWSHLSRQVGGIGTRGPGETQLEVDRRLVRTRIRVLTEALSRIESQREVRRRGREDSLKVALVGYTNAGKSTLLNSLTESDVFVEDRLFATLDATIRRMELPNSKDALLIDTVGFIRKLPHNLVASFKSTLEEAAAADVLLHTVDVTHPSFFDHIAVVKDVLNELNLSGRPTIFVFNKIDKLENPAIIQRLKSDYEPAVFISAAKGLFLDDLKDAIVKIASASIVRFTLTLAISRPELVARLYKLAEVVKTAYEESHVEVTANIARSEFGILKNILDREAPGLYSLREF